MQPSWLGGKGSVVGRCGGSPLLGVLLMVARRLRLVALDPGARRRRLRRRRRQGVQSVEVRDYIADQATLRLARTSNFVSAARPVVSDAIAAAIATPPVEEAIRDFAQRAHEQVFQAHGRAAGRRRTRSRPRSRSAARCRRSTRRWRRSSRPTCSTRRRSISQSSTVDVLFRTSRVGGGPLHPDLPRRRRAADPRDGARRASASAPSAPSASRWRSPVGCCSGSASPRRRSPTVAGTDTDPLRGDAVASFIAVLVGRLVGAGQLFFVLGLALALAPGHDGGDLRDRVDAGPGVGRREAHAPAVALRRWRRARWSWPLLALTDAARPRSASGRASPPSSCSTSAWSSASAPRACSSPTTPSRGSTSARCSACSPR